METNQKNRKQTLNHFIEIQRDQDGFIWIMIHSGSRNFGWKIADKYMCISKTLCKQWHSNILTTELSFLPIGSSESYEYVSAMGFALSFAKENRKRMMDSVKKTMCELILDPIDFAIDIDVHHNYANCENHFGKNVIVHRKGATSAREGQVGIIPGSQGTKSYIVRGKGNINSFMSCSHGAGRKMSRTAAIKNLNLEEEKKKLDDLNIVHSIRNTNDLDEASGAYKDINEVMKNQEDLVEIVTELSPLAVLKDTSNMRR